MPSVSRRDLLDALDHMSDEAPAPLRLEDFEVSSVQQVRIDDLYEYDDIDAWAEFDDGELAELDRDEACAEVENLRGTHLCKWMDQGTVPPIVVVDHPEYAGIGDGRGRVTMAIGMGWDKIPAVFLRPKTSARRVASAYLAASGAFSAAARAFTMRGVSKDLRGLPWRRGNHPGWETRYVDYDSVYVHQERYKGMGSELYKVVWYTGDPNQYRDSKTLDTLKEAVAWANRVKPGADLAVADAYARVAQGGAG